MATISTAPIFARDIITYDDSKLDKHLRENAGFLHVEDSDNLPDSFIQRLRDRTSRPMDFDKVVSKLQQYADRQRSPSTPQPTSPSTDRTITPIPYDDPRHLQFLSKCYQALLESGGRPSHPLSCIRDIIHGQGEDCEILSYWEREQLELLFQNQLLRWQEFLRLQRYARGQSPYDYWRSEWEFDRFLNSIEPLSSPPYDEAKWEEKWRNLRKRYGDMRVVCANGDPLAWEWFVKHSRRVPKHQGFSDYVAALKERLESHGFTRRFELDEDVTRQDKLTTWIEYLGYEYLLHDRYSPNERSQQQVNRLWRELVDSGVIRPGETERSVREDSTAFQDASEYERLEEAVRCATIAVSSAEKAISTSQGSGVPSQAFEQRLSEAQSALTAVKEEQSYLKKRIDLISDFCWKTKDFSALRRRSEHHAKLLRWVQQQLHLIEEELNCPSTERGHCGQKDNGRKRKCSEQADDEHRPQKRERIESTKRVNPDSKMCTNSANHAGGRSKRGHGVVEDGRRSKTESERDRSPSHSARLTSVSQPNIAARATKMAGAKLRRSLRIANMKRRLNSRVTSSPATLGGPSTSAGES